MIYLNWRGPQGCETVDQIDPAEHLDRQAAETEARRLIAEYALAGMIGVYQSSRPCAD